MSENQPVFVVLAIGVAVTAAVVFSLDKASNAPPSASSDAAAAAKPDPEDEEPDEPVLTPKAIERPEHAIAEFEIFTDRSNAELEALTAPRAAVALLRPAHCGAKAVCDAVSHFLLGDGHLQIAIKPALDAVRPMSSDMGRVAATLTDAEKDKALAMPRALIVRVSGDALPDQLPARGGFAVVAALAERTKGFVFDAVTDRLERPATFLTHAITEPLGASVYRKDRVQIEYDPSDEGGIRLLSTGLLRFGAPDLVVTTVPRSSAQHMADVLGALAQALADGAVASPLTIDMDAIERARGAKFGADAGLPPKIGVAIGLDSIPPREGDPNENMVVVSPREGPSATAYEDLATLFFGAPLSEDDNPPSGEDLEAIRTKTQKLLPDLLARYKKMNHDEASLFLQIPFLNPEEESPNADPMKEPEKFDFIWIDVTSWDDTTVTGTPIDDSTVVPGLTQGASVTQPRSKVTDYDLKSEDGGHESAGIPDSLGMPE
jgi:hypothetical protein